MGFVADHPGAGRNAIRRGAVPGVSETTVWRALAGLVDEGRLRVSGKGRGTGYSLAGASVVRAHLQTPYNRRTSVGYQPELLDAYIPGKTSYLSEATRRELREAGTPVAAPAPASTYARRILEQLLVDLSWASSRMEGNTYDILQTEHLIKYGKAAEGKDRKETLMILNHKAAIEYLADNLVDIRLSRTDLFNIHALLADGLLADPSMAGRLRAMPVGVSYSSYAPMDDGIVIAEEFDIALQKAAAIADPYEQSFFLLAYIPYLQAFQDVNKRTSRIASNIPLLKAGLAPMSFFAVNDRDYIDGLLGIYELNDVSMLREAYIDGYLASAGKYRTLLAEVDDPPSAALAHRDFVKEAVRHCVLRLKDFQPDVVRELAAKHGIPEKERDAVADYVGQQFKGLHEGNLIRYQLKLEDLQAMDAGGAG